MASRQDRRSIPCARLSRPAPADPPRWPASAPCSPGSGFRAPSRHAPRSAKLQPVLLGVHQPHHRHVPSLRKTQRFQNAHRRHFRRSVLAHNLAHHQLQRQPVFALLLLASRRAAGSAPPADCPPSAAGSGSAPGPAPGRPAYGGAAAPGPPPRHPARAGNVQPPRPRDSSSNSSSNEFSFISAALSSPKQCFHAGFAYKNRPAGLSVAIISLEFSNRSR